MFEKVIPLSMKEIEENEHERFLKTGNRWAIAAYNMAQATTLGDPFDDYRNEGKQKWYKINKKSS